MATSIIYTELPAKYPCIRTHFDTIKVFLQEDLSLDINNNFQVKIPLAFKIRGGIVAIDSVDSRLVPVKEVYMFDSPPDGLVITLYNRSFSRVSISEGDHFLSLCHVSG